MPTNKKRFMVTVTSEIHKELIILKKEHFYDTSYSEMLRYLLQKGLEVEKSNKNNEEKSP